MHVIGLLVDWTWLRGRKIFELVDISIETSKTEKQREQRLKTEQNKTKYPRSIGQLQKM